MIVSDRSLPPTERTALSFSSIERECRSLRRGAGAFVAAAAIVAVVAGCAGGPGPAQPVTALPSAAVATSAVATPGPLRTTPPPATPRATASRGAGASTRLPWPSATPQAATALQRQVDGGAQPWLLDPLQVAQSYAVSLGWRDPQVSGGGSTSPTRVTVRSSAGTHTLTLVQPGTRGPGGIWLVTADAG